MSLVIDGADWNFDDSSPAEVVAYIDIALEFVEACNNRGETILIGEDFQSRPMRGADGLWQIAGNLPGEINQELAAWLGRTSIYLDVEDWPDGFDDIAIAVDDLAPADNADIAWVHHNVRNRRAMACISFRQLGLRKTRSTHGEADVHFVGDERSRIAFWRGAIKLEGDDVASLVRFAPSAYPNLHFMPGVIGNVDRFGGGYLAARDKVKAAFEALDDYGAWIFTEAPPAVSPNEPRRGTDPAPTNQIIEERFLNVGLDAAPENPNVRQRDNTRIPREAVLGKAKLYCEWHIKIEPHRNRIHLHAPVQESQGRVVIGMIDDHLPLP